MSGWLLAAVALVYVAVAANYATARQWGMCVAFVAYALANVGFMLDLSRRQEPPAPPVTETVYVPVPVGCEPIEPSPDALRVRLEQ